jgi:alpha-tubulin suppressor-like RCC1 family protein
VTKVVAATDAQGVQPLRLETVSAGYAFNCAIRASDALYCWGGNGNGQLGIGSDDPSFTTPRRVA